MIYDYDFFVFLGAGAIHLDWECSFLTLPRDCVVCFMRKFLLYLCRALRLEKCACLRAVAGCARCSAWSFERSLWWALDGL